MSNPPLNQKSRTSRSRLISNAAFSAVAYIVYLPVTFWISRYVVHRIGLESFGIWAALTTMTGFSSMLDLGISTPLVKYAAEYLALGKEREVNRLLGTAMAVYGAISALFVLGMTLASGLILTHLFHVNPNDSAFRLLYLATVVAFAIDLVFNVLDSLLLALQRADVVAQLNLGFNLVSAAGTVLVLQLGLGVYGLALNWIVVTMAINLRNFVLAKRLFRPLVLNPFLFNFRQLRMVLAFSSRVQVTTVMLVLNNQVDRILIASVLGPAQLGYYQLASRAADSVRGMSLTLMQTVLAAASDLAALNQHDRLRQLYLRVTHYLAIVDFPLCFAVAALARPAVALWLGPGYDRVAATIVIVLTGYLSSMMIQPLDNTLNGTGRPGIRMRADVLFLMVHIPLSATLLWRFGYYGTVTGTALALISTRLYFFWWGTRALQIPWQQVARSGLMQPAIGAAFAAAGAIAVQASGVPTTVLTLIGEVVLFGAIYVGYIVTFGIDVYDREMVKSYASAARHAALELIHAAQS